MSDSQPKSPSKKRKSLFQKIKWGSFKHQLQNYRGKHPKTKQRTLKKFAQFVRKHPNKFQSKTRKRANFYVNVISNVKHSKKNTSNPSHQ